jgi:hypothetical protein
MTEKEAAHHWNNPPAPFNPDYCPLKAKSLDCVVDSLEREGAYLEQNYCRDKTKEEITRRVNIFNDVVCEMTAENLHNKLPIAALQQEAQRRYDARLAQPDTLISAQATK